MLISVDLGLVVGLAGMGLAGAAGGVEGAGDLGGGQAGLAGGGGQRAQVGGRVRFEGAVGGPEQAGVAVALGLGGDPAGQVVQVAAGSLALPRLGQAGLALRVQEGGDGGPVQGAGLAAGGQDPVAMAADLGGRRQDVPAGRAEVQVAVGQVAAALGGAGEVEVQAAAGGADPGGGAVQQPGVAEPCGVAEAVAGVAVLVDVQVLRGAEDADVGGVRGADVGGVLRPRSRVAAGPWW
jgi:hypothetical protein